MFKEIALFLILLNTIILPIDTQVKYIGNTLFVLNDDGFFRQIDSQHFQKITLYNNILPKQIICINDSAGYVVGDKDLFKTTNNGANWTLIKTFSVSIIDIVACENSIVIWGSDNRLYYPLETGSNWVNVAVNLAAPSYGYKLFAIKPPNQIYISYIHKPYLWPIQKWDYSSYPYYQMNSTPWTFTGLGFLTGSYGYNSTVSTLWGGNNFEITSDGGAGWRRVSNLWKTSSVCALDSTAIYLSTNVFKIIKLTDNGTTWEIIDQQEPNAEILSLAVSNEALAYSIVGEKSVFVSYNEGLTWEKLNPVLLTPVDEEIKIPNKFTLYNNYPNPFNPSTVIRFEIPERGYVNISIYDLLGKKITTLTDETYNAGTFEVVFNTNLINDILANGVYFYKMQYGNKTVSKKMILIK